MEATYKKSRGNAGLDGVQFQVGLLAVVILNAYRKLKDWKLSSENQDAAKFDDLVLELPDGSAVLLQAKFKASKKITKQQLLSTNSKTSDFSLAKYFFSYQEIKTKFNVKSIIICTNASVNNKGLEGALIRHRVDQDNVLYYDEDNFPFFTFSEKMLPNLKANAEIYFKDNLQNKGIDEAVITEENIKEFLGYLQFIFNYPSGERMLKVIDQLLSLLKDSSLVGKISSQDVYNKVEDWFKQPKGEYLTDIRLKAMFIEIRSDKYCLSLKDSNVSMENNNFNFTDSKRIYHVVAEGGYLLQSLKIYQALQKCSGRKLYVTPGDDAEVLEEAINAFDLRRYTYLIVIWANTNDESMTSDKLGEILEKYQYKKIILVAEAENEFPRPIGLNNNDCSVIDGFVTLEDLSRDAKERILRRKNIVFQGKSVSLEELLPPQTIENYGSIIHSEILETLLREEEIKVGTPPADLDKHTHRYYVSRTFERTVDKTEDIKWNKDGKMKTSISQGIGRGEKTEETIPENNIFDVDDKLILIADIAGMGKSTILTRLAITIKINNPYLWVIKIELNDYTKILRDLIRNGKEIVSVTELLNSRDATKLTNRLEKHVFTVSQKVVLMLDGIDEVSPDYTRLILNLLRQCLEESNFLKIIVTTRSHMSKDLETTLKVKPFLLQPFSDQNQLDFLTSYWAHNLKLKDGTSKAKCKRYAEALISNISWKHLDDNKDNHFASVPLHLRMAAEIFQENTRLNESTDWSGCREYIRGDETEVKLTKRMKVTRLYELFVEKKRDIFMDKGNPTGNTAANQALTEQFHQCLVYHQSLALEVILGEDKCRYFSSYIQGDKSVETNVLKIGVVQKSDGKFHFVHRTFADYFVAECLLAELQRNQTLEFHTFLIDTILLQPRYNTTRIFFDNFLQKIVDTLPSTIFDKYRSVKQESTWESYKLQSELIHLLAREGCMTILQFLLNCIGFKTITDKVINVRDFYESDFDVKDNTLNVLQRLTRIAGINITDTQGWTPLVSATLRSHFETVKFLVELGADCNIKNNDGFTALHAAAQSGRLDIVKFLVEYGSEFNVTSVDGFTPLFFASDHGHLGTVKFLVELGADCNIKLKNGHTALHVAAAWGRLDIVKFLAEYGSEFNVTTTA